MNRLTAFVAACFAICFATSFAGIAQAGNLVDVQVISRSSGQPSPAYFHHGRSYVVGTPGERYSVRLANRTNARVMVVLSVDGVNAITGDTASGNQSGYVLSPWQTTEITGWRKSTEEVARFYFTSLADSYAARTDRPDNVGVIGVAAFREYVEPVVSYQPAPFLNKSDAARNSAAPAAAESASGMLARRKDERLGTGYGERESSVVTYTAFRRASKSPDEIVAIWYDSREQLASRGIIPRPAPCCGYPDPFPGQFVPEPKG
jgi:hypothetical protein